MNEMRAPSLHIGPACIGGDSPVYVVAEAGVNHDGEVAIARDLIDAAIEAKADAVKFQVFSADRLHMHHRLLESEGSQRSAVLSLYFLTACFCVIALSFTKLGGIAAILFLAMVIGLTYRLLRNLGLFDAETKDASNQGRPPGAGGRG